MALRTVSGAVEIAGAGFRIAGLDVGYVDVTPASTDGFRFGLLVVDERDNGVNIRLAQIESRHTFVHTAFVHERPDFVPLQILSHEVRPRQVGACFAAGGIAAMAERAFVYETALACHHDFARIGLRCDRSRRSLRRRTLLHYEQSGDPQ